ncbi:hypothetical protein AVEN_49077-1 [Araneus ventricosus]|uniref:Uncharacterized protein n=1 Tax=Araneus ventricosus TaxID=182803 RepID=A0A4Y2GYU4_ARAVE|nr:hypothetical protein AVEN_49077-1 [Araneus ventricosus]
MKFVFPSTDLRSQRHKFIFSPLKKIEPLLVSPLPKNLLPFSILALSSLNPIVLPTAGAVNRHLHESSSVLWSSFQRAIIGSLPFFFGPFPQSCVASGWR